MNNQEFIAARERLNATCERILIEKGASYAGNREDTDRLTNFKLVAQLLDTFEVDVGTPLGSWAVYMLKHVFAILAYIGQGSESEPIIGRFADLRNYTDLGYGLVEELEAELSPEGAFARACFESVTPTHAVADESVPNDAFAAHCVCGALHPIIAGMLAIALTIHETPQEDN